MNFFFTFSYIYIYIAREGLKGLQSNNKAMIKATLLGGVNSKITTMKGISSIKPLVGIL